VLSTRVRFGTGRAETGLLTHDNRSNRHTPMSRDTLPISSTSTSTIWLQRPALCPFVLLLREIPYL
jgi:hypothetical protein